MLALAPKTVPVAAMDAASLAFRPDTFDAALMVFVLFLLPEPIVALAEVRRALRAGGVVGIATWSHPLPDLTPSDWISPPTSPAPPLAPSSAA